MSRLSIRLLVFVAITWLSACGSGVGNTVPTATVTTNAPAATDPALIPETTVIAIHFSESMNVASLVLGGDLSGESNGGVWSQTNTVNDTLTISPASNWTAKPARQLTINATDLDGSPLATLNLTYDVYRGTLYYVVGNYLVDTGDGLTPATARRYISTAMADATPPATILVSAFTYVSGMSLLLREGVSLYGGYNLDFTQRDPANQVTTIQGNSLGARNAGNRLMTSAIGGDGSTTPITRATVIDGFTIRGSEGGSGPGYAIDLEVNASPTLQNNVIHGGGVSLFGFNTYGIGVLESSPLIQNNTIHAGLGAEAGERSFGIALALSDASVINNRIFGGGSLISSGDSYGITLTDSSPTLRNNTIHSGISDPGIASPSYAIYSSGTSHPVVQNNLLMSKAGTQAICYVESGNAQPAVLQNNSFFQCDVMYWDDDLGCLGMAFCETLDQLHAMADITGGLSGNVIADPQLADLDGPDDILGTMDNNDWHFSVNSPASVTTGGLNGLDQMPVWSYTTDKDGVVRPASGNPWSIGAYQ